MFNHRERVKCAPEYHALFRDIYPLKTHETFFLCACIGHSRGHRVPLGKSEDSFWSDTMPVDEFNCYALMLFEGQRMSPEALKEDNVKSILELAQEYANGGMKILLDEVIGEHVEKNERGIYELIPNGVELLPKTILCWLSEATEQADEPIEVEVVPQS